MKNHFQHLLVFLPRKSFDKVTFYRYLHFPRQAGSMATSTFGEYISYNIQQCLSWHFQTILKIVDTKDPVEFKVKYQLKMKLRQNFVHSVCVSGCIVKHQRLKGPAHTAGTSKQPSKPPKEPHIQTKHKQN